MIQKQTVGFLYHSLQQKIFFKFLKEKLHKAPQTTQSFTNFELLSRIP